MAREPKRKPKREPRRKTEPDAAREAEREAEAEREREAERQAGRDVGSDVGAEPEAEPERAREGGAARRMERGARHAATQRAQREPGREPQREPAHVSRRGSGGEVDYTKDPEADIELEYEADREERHALRLRVDRVAGREAAEEAEEFRRPRVESALWLGVLGPPLLLLLHQQLNYMLVPWSCDHDSPWVLHLVSLVLIAATMLIGIMALRLWRRSGSEPTTQGAGPLPRGRFMAMLGIASGAFFALIIFTQWLPVLYLTPCRGA